MGFVLESPLSLTGRARFVPGVILVVLLGFAFWGYRASRPNLDPDIAARTAAGVTVLMETEDYEGAVGGSGLSGILEVLPGGCLGLGAAGPWDGTLLVFPPGTEVSDDGGRLNVRFPGSSNSNTTAVTLRPGSTISGGTRFSEGPVPIGDYEHLAEHTPRACRGHSAMNVDAD